MSHIFENKKLNVSISCIEENKNWVFTCSDNGIGIEPEYHEKIFQLFQRLNSNSENQGAGMGLPLTKKANEILGGKIELKENTKEGTIFYFSLPKKESR